MNNLTHWITGLDYGSIIVTLIVILIFYYAGTAIVRKTVKHAVETTKHHDWHRKDIEKRQKTLVGLFVNIWQVLVLSIGALQLFVTLFPAISLAPLFASAGVLGVALGFGSQSLVKDFLSGIFIISENQYRVGDIIEIDSADGTVERIGARSTVLRDADGNVHYFPNGMIQHIVNKTMGYSMARFSIAVAPSSDLDVVVGLINETGIALAGEEKWKMKIIDAPAFVSVDEFTASSVNLLISGKTQPSDQWAVTAEMRRRLLAIFEKKDIMLSATAPSPASSSKKKK
jgi:small-conductance mechanosensitive channel